jgi:hypothetical protein
MKIGTYNSEFPPLVSHRDQVRAFEAQIAILIEERRVLQQRIALLEAQLEVDLVTTKRRQPDYDMYDNTGNNLAPLNLPSHLLQSL